MLCHQIIVGEDIMTTNEQPLDLAAMADANRMAELRLGRLNKIYALDATPEQQEALQWARVDFAAASARAFQARVRVFSRFGSADLKTARRMEARAALLAVVRGGRR